LVQRLKRFSGPSKTLNLLSLNISKQGISNVKKATPSN